MENGNEKTTCAFCDGTGRVAYSVCCGKPEDQGNGYKDCCYRPKTRYRDCEFCVEVEDMRRRSTRGQAATVPEVLRERPVENCPLVQARSDRVLDVPFRNSDVGQEK